MKLQHGKVATASGQFIDLTPEEFSHVLVTENKRKNALSKLSKQRKAMVASNTSEVAQARDFQAAGHNSFSERNDDSAANDKEVADISSKMADQKNNPRFASVTNSALVFQQQQLHVNAKLSPVVAKPVETNTTPPQGVAILAKRVQVPQQISNYQVNYLNTQAPANTASFTSPQNTAFFAQINGQQVLLIPTTPNNQAVALPRAKVPSLVVRPTASNISTQLNNPNVVALMRRNITSAPGAPNASTGSLSGNLVSLDTHDQSTRRLVSVNLANLPKGGACLQLGKVPKSASTPIRTSINLATSESRPQAQPTVDASCSSKLEQCLRYGSASLATYSQSPGEKSGNPTEGAKDSASQVSFFTVNQEPVAVSVPDKFEEHSINTGTLISDQGCPTQTSEEFSQINANSYTQSTVGPTCEIFTSAFNQDFYQSSSQTQQGQNIPCSQGCNQGALYLPNNSTAVYSGQNFSRFEDQSGAQQYIHHVSQDYDQHYTVNSQDQVAVAQNQDHYGGLF